MKSPICIAHSPKRLDKTLFVKKNGRFGKFSELSGAKDSLRVDENTSVSTQVKYASEQSQVNCDDTITVRYVPVSETTVEESTIRMRQKSCNKGSSMQYKPVDETKHCDDSITVKYVPGMVKNKPVNHDETIRVRYVRSQPIASENSTIKVRHIPSTQVSVQQPVDKVTVTYVPGVVTSSSKQCDDVDESKVDMTNCDSRMSLISEYVRSLNYRDIKVRVRSPRTETFDVKNNECNWKSWSGLKPEEFKEKFAASGLGPNVEMVIAAFSDGSKYKAMVMLDHASDDVIHAVLCWQLMSRVSFDKIIKYMKAYSLSVNRQNMYDLLASVRDHTTLQFLMKQLDCLGLSLCETSEVVTIVLNGFWSEQVLDDDLINRYLLLYKYDRTIRNRSMVPLRFSCLTASDHNLRMFKQACPWFSMF